MVKISKEREECIADLVKGNLWLNGAVFLVGEEEFKAYAAEEEKSKAVKHNYNIFYKDIVSENYKATARGFGLWPERGSLGRIISILEERQRELAEIKSQYDKALEHLKVTARIIKWTT